MGVGPTSSTLFSKQQWASDICLHLTFVYIPGLYDEAAHRPRAMQSSKPHGSVT